MNVHLMASSFVTQKNFHLYSLPYDYDHNGLLFVCLTYGRYDQINYENPSVKKKYVRFPHLTLHFTYGSVGRGIFFLSQSSFSRATDFVHLKV
jgi:hypothetical protein